MRTPAFETPIVLTGPLRAPRQMLADQSYDGHESIHDDAMAAKLGFAKIPATAHSEATLACDFQFTAPVEAEVGARAEGSLTAGIKYETGSSDPSSTSRSVHAGAARVQGRTGCSRRRPHFSRRSS